MDSVKEINKLFKLTEEFRLACLVKLTKKLSEGYTGSDCEAIEPFKYKIVKLSKEELTQKNLINIANYCSFLWYRAESKKGGETK